MIGSHVLSNNNDFYLLTGSGFMRIFGNILASRGSSLCTYFRLLRPRGVALDFHEILKRVNTPFMFCLKIPGNTSLAEVCKHNFTVKIITSTAKLLRPKSF